MKTSGDWLFAQTGFTPFYKKNDRLELWRSNSRNSNAFPDSKISHLGGGSLINDVCSCSHSWKMPYEKGFHIYFEACSYFSVVKNLSLILKLHAFFIRNRISSTIPNHLDWIKKLHTHVSKKSLYFPPSYGRGVRWDCPCF